METGIARSVSRYLPDRRCQRQPNLGRRATFLCDLGTAVKSYVISLLHLAPFEQHYPSLTSVALARRSHESFWQMRGGIFIKSNFRSARPRRKGYSDARRVAFEPIDIFAYHATELERRVEDPFQIRHQTDWKRRCRRADVYHSEPFLQLLGCSWQGFTARVERQLKRLSFLNL